MKRIRRLSTAIAVILIGVWLSIWIVVEQPVFASNPRSAITADREALQRHVRTISETYFPRSFQHVRNLDLCAEYIRQEFLKTGARVRVQEYAADGIVYRNVIARFGPDDRDLTVVGAHYDACGDTPGADDNASGVAGLIELAALLSKHPTGRNIELVAYTLEEPPVFRSPFMGSAVHADDLRKRKVDIRAVIVLEMIGYFSDAWWSQSYPLPLLRLFYPSRGNFLALVGRLDQRAFVRGVKARMQGTTALPVYSINAPTSLPGLDFSDHLNYWRNGYQAVMVTDTAFYRNKEYHQPGDTWKRLDYARMADVVVMVYEAIAAESAKR